MLIIIIKFCPSNVYPKFAIDLKLHIILHKNVTLPFLKQKKHFVFKGIFTYHIPTYVLPTYLPTYLSIYLLMSNLPTYLPTYFLTIYLSMSHLPTYLFSYHLPTYYLLTYEDNFFIYLYFI